MSKARDDRKRNDRLNYWRNLLRAGRVKLPMTETVTNESLLFR